MGKKKYNTDDERKAAQKAQQAKWYQKNRDEIRAQQAEWYQSHKTEKAEYNAERYKQKRDKILAQKAEYNQEHKTEKAEYNAEYRSTKFGRANCLLSCYRNKDKKYNRGDCTLTADWIVENIFTQPCHYCGETDWTKLGCDRIDNSLPHTPENCVCSCWDCNNKRNTTEYSEFMRLIGKIA